MPKIKSIQYGTTFISEGSNVNTVTITPVDMSKTICRRDEKTAADIDPDNFDVTIQLISPTTVRVERYGITGFVEIHWEVIEFTSGVVQRGLHTGNGTDSTEYILLNVIEASKAFHLTTSRTFSTSMIYSLFMEEFGGYDESMFYASQLLLRHDQPYQFTYYEWQVIYDLDNINVQHEEYFFSSPGQYVDINISPVSMANTFTLCSSISITPGYGSQSVDTLRVYWLENTTLLRFFSISVTNSSSFAHQILESSDFSVQRDQLSHTSEGGAPDVSYVDFTLSPSVDWNNSISLICGQHSTLATAYSNLRKAGFMTHKIGGNLVRYSRGVIGDDFMLSAEVVTIAVEDPEPLDRHYVLII